MSSSMPVDSLWARLPQRLIVCADLLLGDLYENYSTTATNRGPHRINEMSASNVDFGWTRAGPMKSSSTATGWRS
jgi:hypothetical protein